MKMWNTLAVCMLAGVSSAVPELNDATVAQGAAFSRRAAADADCLMVESVRESARRVCQMVLKTRRFARERAARP